MGDPVEIRNWRRFDQQITTSGQPREDQLPALAALGVRQVMNLALHSHEEALADEAASLAALGIAYTHLPVEFSNPTDADFNAFCSALEAAGDAPLHIHCIMNYRVTAFLYRYQRDVLGRDEAQARQLMDSVWTPEGVWAEFVAPR